MNDNEIEKGPQTRSERILGSLLLNPELLNSAESLCDKDFSSERERKLFVEISNQWENYRKIDELSLSKALSNGGLTYLQRIQYGLAPGNNSFIIDVTGLKKENQSKRFLSLAEEELRLYRNTGQVSLEKEKRLEIKKILEQLDALDGSLSGPSSTIPISKIKAEPINWLWPNYIPMGRATLISGDPGVGKTFFALDICARLTTGEPWPDGAPGTEPANILYLTVEDGAADTIRPRFEALGGKVDKLFVLDTEKNDLLDLGSGDCLRRLEKEVKQLDIKLLVLDPILDFCGRVNSNSAEAVRCFLNPLIGLAREYNFALLLIAHLNKAESQSAIYRTGGSASGWIGKCRAAFLIFRDQEDRKKRYFLPIKANLAPGDPPQLEFRIQDGRLVYEKVDDFLDPDSYLNPQLRIVQEETDFVKHWLREQLAHGEKELKELKKEASEAKIPERTLFRVSEKIGVIKRTEGFGRFKTSFWSLPEAKK